jgi:hypothetical protein
MVLEMPFIGRHGELREREMLGHRRGGVFTPSISKP